MSAVLLEHVTKRFGDFVAVDDLSVDIAAGTVVAFLGQNGAGKTTTMEIAEGFVAPTSGRVRVLDCDPVRRDRRWRARVGLVSQSTSLDPQLAVREVLELFAGLFPRPLAVPRVLTTMGLDDDAAVRIGALSGGQRGVSTSVSPSSADPTCCSSTSRRPASTRTRGAARGTRSAVSPPRGPPSC
jgi:ABC-2 type transport system ATP-binding protein